MALNNSIKVGPLVFLLNMFVIAENIMKRPVFVFKKGAEQNAEEEYVIECFVIYIHNLIK